MTDPFLVAGVSADRVELNLVRGLHGAGVGLVVWAEPGSPAVGLCEELGVSYIAQSVGNRFDRSAVARFRELQARHGFGLVHCLSNRGLSTALLAVRKLAQPPRIVGYRGTIGHLSRWDPASHFSYLNKRVDCIVCVSDAVRRYLQGFGIPDERLEVIWKGHDPAWYAPAPRQDLEAFGIPPDATVACFTGNIRPVKGVTYLLDAFEAMGVREDLHLLVLGEVRDPSVAKRVGGQENVHFAGFREDATALAGACDFAVMPSVEREGLPKSVLESMAQGLPAVVTSVGGLPELVQDGVCGLLVPPRQSGPLKEAILRLADDQALRAQMGRAALERVRGDFHFSHTLEKTLALYQRLVSRR